VVTVSFNASSLRLGSRVASCAIISFCVASRLRSVSSRSWSSFDWLNNVIVKPRIENTTNTRITHFHGGNPHWSDGTSTPIAAKNTMHTPEIQIHAFFLVRCNVIMRRMVLRMLLLRQLHNPVYF